jgi:serine protease inhibitor
VIAGRSGPARSATSIVTMPRFQFSYEAKLTRLTDMGMGVAFDENNADFGDIYLDVGANAYIGWSREDLHQRQRARHRSGRRHARRDADESMPQEVVFDRPFFAIYDTSFVQALHHPAP